MVVIIFLGNLFVQIVGAACDSAPADANVWSVTDFSEWAPVGRGLLHTKLPLPGKSKPSGVYSVVQVAMQAAGDRKPKPMEKASSPRPVAISFFYFILFNSYWRIF